LNKARYAGCCRIANTCFHVFPVDLRRRPGRGEPQQENYWMTLPCWKIEAAECVCASCFRPVVKPIVCWLQITFAPSEAEFLAHHNFHVDLRAEDVCITACHEGMNRSQVWPCGWDCPIALSIFCGFLADHVPCTPRDEGQAWDCRTPTQGVCAPRRGKRF
jgi:hypothetical protein